MSRFLVFVLAWLFASDVAVSMEINGQLVNAQLQKLTSNPTCSEARIFYDTDDGEVRFCNGASTWLTVADSSNAVVNPMDSEGDMIVGGSSGAATKLDSGTSGQWLTSAGAASPAWSDTTNRAKTFIDSDVQVFLGDSQTNSTQKVARAGALHYTNSEESSAIAVMVNSASANSLRIGGSAATMNAATNIGFYTAATNTTTTGTQRMNIQDDGGIDISDTGGNGGNIVHGCIRRTNACAAVSTCSVSCSAGEIVTGGGCDTNGTLQSSYSTNSTTWSCNTIANATINMSAICCDY